MATKYEICKECNYIIKRTRIGFGVCDIFKPDYLCELCKGAK